MGRIDELADRYEQYIAPLWQRNLAGAERTIFIVYPKEDERKLLARRHDFEVRTRAAGYSWKEFDFTDIFPRWMSEDDYRGAYFECPEDIEMKLDSEFTAVAVDLLRKCLISSDVDSRTVVGVVGAATLYGLTRISTVLRAVEADIRGRLVLFFPGEYEDKNYRLLDARDGWNYLAVPITLHQGDIDQ